MRNDISIIDVVGPNPRGVSSDQNGPALIITLDNDITDSSAVTAEQIFQLLDGFDITDPEAIHRVIIVSSEADHSISYEDLVLLREKYHMKLIGVMQSIEVQDEYKEQTMVLKVDTTITENTEGEIALPADANGSRLLFEPIFTEQPVATMQTAHSHYDIPLHHGKQVRNLAATAKGPLPKNIQRNQDLLRKAWRINAENVWDPLPKEIIKIFSIGDDTEREREELSGSGYTNNGIGWFNLPHVTADRFAGRLINAPYGSTVWTGSISHGLQQLLSCPEVIKSDRSKIVCTEEDFSGIQQSSELFAKQSTSLGTSYELQRVPSKNGNRFDLDQYLSTLDEQVSLAILPHIGFMNGQRIPSQDIQQVAVRCRQLGIFFAIDGAHAIGEKFVDVTNLNPDAYLSTLMKEGSGSAGSAFMYLNPNVDFNPTLTSWLGHDNPFSHFGSYAGATDTRQRFYGGTPNIANLYQSIEGARIYIESGFSAVEEDMEVKIESAINILQTNDITIASPTDKENRSQLIVLYVDSDPFEIAAELLSEHGIRVYPNIYKERNVLRLSPHICCPLDASSAACGSIAEVIKKHS